MLSLGQRARRIGLCLAWFFAGATQASAAPTFLVIGVIASAEPQEGVALLKSSDKDRAFAAKVGQEITKGMVITKIDRSYVYFRHGDSIEKVKVGEHSSGTYAAPRAPASGMGAGMSASLDTGIERQGNSVRLSASLRDEVVTRQLSTVLMQAASVPYFENGRLIGFQLWDIDPGSLYEKAGFADGDIVTEINGQALSDVAHAIRMLQSLRYETRVEVAFLRKGARQLLEVIVQ